MPLNSRSLDWVVAIGFHTGSHSTVSTLTDLARCLRPSDAPEPASGRLKFVLDSNERDRTAGQLARVAPRGSLDQDPLDAADHAR